MPVMPEVSTRFNYGLRKAVVTSLHPLTCYTEELVMVSFITII